MTAKTVSRNRMIADLTQGVDRRTAFITRAMADRDLRRKWRAFMIDRLVESALGVMFGDGLEREYLLDGLHLKGYNNMTDAELATEFDEAIDLTNTD